MEMNLHRQVLTAGQKRNLNSTANLSPSPGFDGHRKNSIKDDNHKSYKVYLDSVVNQWNGHPDELFKRKNWVHWIRTEANRRNSNDKYLNKKELFKFAGALMELMFAENEPHIDHLTKKFNKLQLERFQKLKKEYDEREHFKLLERINRNLDSESGEGSSDDENVVKNGVNVGEEEVKSTVTPKPIEIHTNQSDQPKLFEEFSQIGVDCINKRQQVMPKTPKRAVDDRNKNGIDRKRQRRLSELDGYKKLTIRKVPKSRIAPENFYSKPAGSSTNSKHPRDGDRLDDNRIRDMLNETFNNEKEEVDIIENSTPPYSPMDASNSNFSQPLDCTTSTTSHYDTRRKVQNGGKPVNSSNTTSNQNYQRKITTDKCFDKVSNSEKENSPQENTKIFGNLFKHQQVRNEPFTSSNITLTEEIYEEIIEIFVVEKESPVTVEEILLRFPKPPSAPALTLEMFEEIKELFEKPAKEKVVSGFGFNILQEDIIIISKETEWLIDLNIDFYLELIKERSKQEGYPSVYIFHSFFYTLLTGKEFGYSAVEDTTGEDDILQFDLLLIPANVNQHWRLIVVKVQEKVIECYDSLDHRNQDVLDSIEGFLLHWEKLRLRRDKIKKTKTDTVNNVEVQINEAEQDSDATTICSEDGDDDIQQIVEACPSPWTKHNKPSASIPQQLNAIDCGVFVLQFAEYLSRQQSFDFDQSHIPYFRKRMTYETLTKTLLTS